ncbi:MAG: hypothetical protein OD918_05580 [Gammaproteobacteria bacterium]
MFERQSDAYRRGLTLGLTMAEIFILVVFMLLLMLLAMSAFNSKSKVDLARTQEALTAAVAERDKARQQIPESIKPLVRKNESLERALKTAKEEASEKTAELEKAQKESENAKQDVDRSRARIESLVRKNELLERDLKTAKEDSSEKTESLEKAQQKNERSKKAIDQLRDKLYASKGIDPTCWYQVTYPQGKRHEKPYYLMDIAVHDEHLRVVLRRPKWLPPGRAVDESGEHAPTSYQQEYERVRARAPLQEAADMSLSDFAEVTAPIRHLGKSEQIRDYACVFYVKVWDKTGPEEKERWKEGTTTIKGSFYVYYVQDDPWPGDVGN